MKCQEFGPFMLERSSVHYRTGKWTRAPIEAFEGSSKWLYLKVSRCPEIERLGRVPEAQKFTSVDSGAITFNEVEEREKTRIMPVTAEEAEKLADDMIKSYSKNNPMRQLLEDARFFAGAATLSGAVGVRRARAQITRFEP